MIFYKDGSYSSGAAPGPKPLKRPVMKTVLTIVVVILLIVTALDSFYTLKEDQYGVITTFGKPSMVTTSGAVAGSTPRRTMPLTPPLAEIMHSV